jgi:hypothetical protein
VGCYYEQKVGLRAANTLITIGLPQNEITQIEISNLLGEILIRSLNQKEIDISDLPKAMYTICARQNGSIYLEKFVKH